MPAVGTARRATVALGALVALVLVVSGCAAHRGPAAVRTMHLTSPTGQAELVLRPPGPLRGLVVFMHGLNADQDQLIEDPGLFPVRRALLAAGYAIVASNAHGNNAGNPASVQDQVDALADAEARLPAVPQVDVLAFSMGGLDALLTAAGHDLRGLHALALLSPAVDQTSFLTGSYAGAIVTAFGDPPASEVAELVRRSDPVAQPVSDYVGYSYHFWQSPDDHTVPAAQTIVMSQYLATGGISAPISPLTGDHGDLSALDPKAVVALFAAPTPQGVTS